MQACSALPTTPLPTLPSLLWPTGAGLVEKTANYIGDTAAKYSKK